MCQGELHEEVIQTLDYLKNSSGYVNLVLDMAPESQLRSAFLLMKDHIEAAMTLGQSANCATSAAKLTLPQPPPSILCSSTQHAKRKRRFSGSTLTAAQAEGLVAGPPVQTIPPPLVNPNPNLPADVTGLNQTTGGEPTPAPPAAAEVGMEEGEEE